MSYHVTRIFLVITLLCALTGTALAQKTVTGTVTDATNGIPLPGVNIVIQGTQLGTVTDLNGSYTVQVPGNDAVLQFSFVGYLTVNETVGDRTTIDVALQEDVELLGDIVVIGYGTQRRESVTGSVSTVRADEALQGLVTAPTQILQGRVPGVSIVQNSGEPGSGVQIRVRGGTSISASNEPLYVIDGVPIDNATAEPEGMGVSTAAPAPRNPLNLLNPNDIESITVLKDASATAIYGSRGANGVVLIETRRGLANRLTVDYDGYVSSSSAANRLDVLTGSEYKNFLQQAINAYNSDATDPYGLKPTDADNNGQPDQIQNLGTNNTDWQKEILRSSVSTSHNLALAGGLNTGTSFRASVSYLDEQGPVISSGMERITGRLNANHSAWDNRLRFDLSVQTAYLNNDYQPSDEQSGFEGAMFANVLQMNPTNPVTTTNAAGEEVYFETGTGALSVRNPVALANQLQDYGKLTRTLGNVGVELDLFTGLTARLNVGADRNQGSRRTYWPRLSPVGAQYLGRARQANRELTTSTLQSYLTYNTRIADTHDIELLGGYEYNDYNTEEFRTEARDFVSDSWGYDNLEAGAEVIKPFSYRETSRLVSFFSRANYGYKNKYNLQAVLRYDGSSRFGRGNKWAMFPAVSGSWRLSAEPFMQGISALSDLRVRAGWGIVGSQEIGNYRSLALLTPQSGARAVIGGIPVTGVAPTTYANPDLKWEETTSFNAGIDFGFSGGKYSGTIDVYQKNTKDLLLEIPVPQPAVVSTRLENIGEVRNRGFEASFDALVLDKATTNLTLGLVFATNQNEITKLGRDKIYTGTVSGRGQSGVNAMILDEGHSVPEFYGAVFTGVDENGEQQFEDLDGDGNIEITSDDRTYLGSPLPDWTLGFRAQANVGNFDFSLFLRGEFGRELLNNTALVYQSKSSVTQGQNFLKEALDDPDAVLEPAKFSSRWIQNASFVRLDNVTLGYRLNLANVTSQIRNARIYVSAQNLLTITPYEGLDPEANTSNTGLAAIGIDWMRYPRSRTFTMGVSLGF